MNDVLKFAGTMEEQLSKAEARATASERQVEALTEAGWLLLSEIDAGNGAEDIKGATGPLRAAILNPSEKNNV